MAFRSIRVAERLAIPTSVHGVAGSNPAGGEILLEPKRRFIARSLSCSPFHRLEMTEILLKGRKTLTHPSIQWLSMAFQWCCSTPQGSPGVGRNTFLSSPHLCFITVFICDLFVSRDDPLMS